MVHEIEHLYRLHYRRYLRTATAITGSEERAADAVHDAFVSALRNADAYERRGPLEAWVWRIVVNAAQRARVTATAPLDERLRDSQRDNGSAPVVHHVSDAVTALPPRQRLCVFLRHYADLDYRTIGEVLEVRPGTVAATLHAAHAALRVSLEEVRTHGN